MRLANIELVIVLEGDVGGTENTGQLFASLLANMSGNKALKDCQYVALAVSDWHSGHSSCAR